MFTQLKELELFPPPKLQLPRPVDQSCVLESGRYALLEASLQLGYPNLFGPGP